ncbi:MAG: polysaccharide deacetylase [Friedmanniella sp.]|nr:polysaccharide deacetylase [Friedmanniella sp.]
MPPTPRFSIVIPTFNRREVLLQTLHDLGRLEAPWPVEVVVVVDGSQDGSVEAAREVALPFPTRVLYQPNSGAAAARNRGAAAARGDYLLFLDDDMAADPRLLIEHDRALAAGADAVVGHMPLHPDSPPTVLTPGVQRWADTRLARIQQRDRPLEVSDLLTGQLSVRAGAFADLGGFDARLNEGGTFGAEDTDFLYRLLRSGSRVEAAPDAISHQRYVVTPRQLVRQWGQGGRADVLLTGKHPELTEGLFRAHGGHTVPGRVLRRLARRGAGPLESAASRVLLDRADAGRADWLTQTGLRQLRDVAYWRGQLAEQGAARFRRRPAVLAYHAIEDVDDPVTGRYAVTPAEFAAQVEALHAAGYAFLDPEQFCTRAADPDGDDQPSVLLTFDDGYASFVWGALPVLRRFSAPAVVFVVTGHVGDVNAWDVAQGARPLPLLDAEGLRALAADRVSLGSHSRSHAHLADVGPEQRVAELAGARQDFATLGLPDPQLFAYPHGSHSRQVRRLARQAGYRVAFAVAQGSDPDDPYAYPRVEVQRGQDPAELVRRLGRPVPVDRRGQARIELRALVRGRRP